MEPGGGRRALGAVLAVACALALGACGRELTSEPGNPAGAWTFVSGTVDGVSLAPPVGSRVTLDITARALAGRSSCNTYSAEVSVGTDGTLGLGGLTATEIGCPDDTFEARYFTALGRVTRYRFDETYLVLAGDSAELHFAPTAAAPAAALVGSEWVLDTFYTGDLANNAVLPEPARLSLRPDGLFGGHDGCQLFVGEWSEAIGTAPLLGGVLPAGVDPATSVAPTLPEGASATVVHVVSYGVADPGHRCPEATAAAAAHVGTVLGSDFTAIVSGLQLRIVSASGYGLGYHTTVESAAPALPTATLPPSTTAPSTSVASTEPPTTTEPPAPTEPPTAAPTEQPTTTTTPPTEYLPTPGPAVPGVTDPPPAGALAAGTYLGELTLLAGTSATFTLYRAYFGQACLDRQVELPELDCSGEVGYEPGVAVATTVDLGVSTLTVSAFGDAGIANYRVSVGELAGLVGGQPPAAGAPEGFVYTPFLFVLTVREGLVVAAEQLYMS